MNCHTYRPGAPLSLFVDRFWLCEDAPPRARERILPTGTVELVFNLSHDEIRTCGPTHLDGVKRCSGAAVSGPYSRYFVIDPCVCVSVIGVHVRPGGALPLLGVPASELADMHLDLDALWGRTARELRERLCEAPTPAAGFSLVVLAVRCLHRPAQPSQIY